MGCICSKGAVVAQEPEKQPLLIDNASTSVPPSTENNAAAAKEEQNAGNKVDGNMETEHSQPEDSQNLEPNEAVSRNVSQNANRSWKEEGTVEDNPISVAPVAPDVASKQPPRESVPGSAQSHASDLFTDVALTQEEAGILDGVEDEESAAPPRYASGNYNATKDLEDQILGEADKENLQLAPVREVLASVERPAESQGEAALEASGKLMGTNTAWREIAKDVQENGEGEDRLQPLPQRERSQQRRDPLATLEANALKGGSYSSQFREIAVLGQGSYGKAIKALWVSENEIVVVKQIQVRQLDDEERKEARTEVDVLAKLSHPNITQFYFSFVETDILYIVMEYAEGGDLYQFIGDQNKLTKNHITEEKIMFLFVQICLALHHVHSQGILHRDLKTQNIFVGKDDIIKLGDFGIARVMNDASFANTMVGTPFFLSPEICEGKRYNHKSDIWALGCVLYEMVTLKHAFDGTSLPAVVMKIVRGNYPALPTSYSTGLRGLVADLLERWPSHRPDITQILQSHYVQPFVQKYCQHITLKVGGASMARRAFKGSGVEKMVLDSQDGVDLRLSGTSASTTSKTGKKRKPRSPKGKTRSPKKPPTDPKKLQEMQIKASKDEKKKRMELLNKQKQEEEKRRLELKEKNFREREEKRQAKMQKERDEERKRRKLEEAREEERRVKVQQIQAEEEARLLEAERRKAEFEQRRIEEEEMKQRKLLDEQRRIQEHQDRISRVKQEVRTPLDSAHGSRAGLSLSPTKSRPTTSASIASVSTIGAGTMKDDTGATDNVPSKIQTENPDTSMDEKGEPTEEEKGKPAVDADDEEEEEEEDETEDEGETEDEDTQNAWGTEYQAHDDMMQILSQVNSIGDQTPPAPSTSSVPGSGAEPRSPDADSNTIRPPSFHHGTNPSMFSSIQDIGERDTGTDAHEVSRYASAGGSRPEVVKEVDNGMAERAAIIRQQCVSQIGEERFTKLYSYLCLLSEKEDDLDPSELRSLLGDDEMNVAWQVHMLIAVEQAPSSAKNG